MESDPKIWIAALRRSQDRLASEVAKLDPAEREKRSYCEDWSVAEVLSHLGSQADIFESFLDAALSGTEAPGPESFPPIWDRWNSLSPEHQVRESLAANERFVHRLESLPAGALDDVHLLLFGSEMGAVGLIRMRLGELALHTWDVAVVSDASAKVEAAAVDLLVDEAMGQTIARAGKPQGKAFVLRVATSEPERTFTLTVNDDAVMFGPFSGDDVIGTLGIPAEAFLRLVYGRLDPDHTPAGVVLDSADLSVADVRDVFAGL